MNYWISGYGPANHATMALYKNNQAVPLWTADIPNPSYLCQAGRHLFAVGEFDDHCTVTSFLKTDGGDCHNYCLQDTIRLEGTCLCHLSSSPSQHFLAGSCWGDGTFFTLSYTEDGHFKDVLYQEKQTDGTGRKSRAHCALILGEWIYVVNIELDIIFCYHQENGIPREHSRLVLPIGTGPRHLYANQEKKRFYCVTEYSSQLITIDYQNPSRMQVLSSLPLLAPDFKSVSYGSTLAVTQDLRHLYAANRGENTVVHFLLDEDGLPRYSERTSCCGDWPRHIALLDQDRCLAIANQNSGEAVFLHRDPDTGRLDKTPFQAIPHPNASYIHCETA